MRQDVASTTYERCIKKQVTRLEKVINKFEKKLISSKN